MDGVEDSNESIECSTLSADVAARYAFLKAVSHLPHLEVLPRAGIDLFHSIEAEIIPRLVQEHRNAERRAAGSPAISSVSPSELKSFTAAVLLDRIDEASTLVAAMRSRGIPVERIMLDLLAPTAIKLGEMWEDDDFDFLSVTISIGRLQQVLRELSGAFQSVSPAEQPCHKVLLSTVPGETHIFSLLLVDQFFRGDGWDTWTLPGATRNELIDVVGREAFALVGLSVSCDVCISELAQLIPALRSASMNKMLRIMVGGRIFNGRPEFALELGADGTANDGPAALVQARRIVEDRESRGG
jgi:methanogenic corrinoid protein MtbC1